jgi:hypothetical protein
MAAARTDVDTAALDALARCLRDCAGEAADVYDAVARHVPDTGDAATQAALAELGSVLGQAFGRLGISLAESARLVDTAAGRYVDVNHDVELTIDLTVRDLREARR